MLNTQFDITEFRPFIDYPSLLLFDLDAAKNLLWNSMAKAVTITCFIKL